jgi:sugar phosphate permease
MDGVGGYAGWRWIFILEGLLTVLVALVAPFAIHDSPETATFLTEAERRFVLHSLRIQNSSDSHEMVTKDDKFQWRYVFDAFTDWQIWLGLFSKLCVTPSLLTRRIIIANWGKCTGVSLVRYTVSHFSFPLLSRI